MSSNQRVTTNFRRSNGVDVAYEFITKDYLMSVYPGIAQELGKTAELWVWGGNNYGQLGTNNLSQSFNPVTTLAGGSNWRSVSCGRRHTAAIKTDGTLWTWGYNNYGQLGNATTANRSTPSTTFAGGTNWKQVAGGFTSTTAIKTDGTLWIWGRGGYGLGINESLPTGTNRSTPVTTFAGGTNWRQVSCWGSSSGAFNAAIKTDGTLWTWGDNGGGKLGNNISTSRATPITTFAGGTNWKQVSCGGNRMAAIKTDGTFWTWGQNNFGVLGTNNEVNTFTPVTTFAGGTNWKQVSLRENNTAAIKTDGTLWVWGHTHLGQLGNAQNTFGVYVRTPITTFAGGTNWKQASVGSSHMLAIKTDGTLWSWGVGSSGQLGMIANDRSTPVTTSLGRSTWKQVACGEFHTAAIKTSDDLL